MTELHKKVVTLVTPILNCRSVIVDELLYNHTSVSHSTCIVPRRTPHPKHLVQIPSIMFSSQSNCGTNSYDHEAFQGENTWKILVHIGWRCSFILSKVFFFSPKSFMPLGLLWNCYVVFLEDKPSSLAVDWYRAFARVMPSIINHWTHHVGPLLTLNLNTPLLNPSGPSSANPRSNKYNTVLSQILFNFLFN